MTISPDRASHPWPDLSDEGCLITTLVLLGPHNIELLAKWVAGPPEFIIIMSGEPKSIAPLPSNWPSTKIDANALIPSIVDTRTCLSKCPG